MRHGAYAGARDVQRAGNGGDIAFHKGQGEISRPHAVAIAAGVAHSCCLTRLGVVLAWRSWDPALAVQEVSGSLTGKHVVSIAAGDLILIPCTLLTYAAAPKVLRCALCRSRC